MAILESSAGVTTISRCNRTYREFMSRVFGVEANDASIDETTFAPEATGAAFVSAIDQCVKKGGHVVFDEQVSDDLTVHAFMRYISTNPVTGVVACVVVVLGVVEDPSGGLTYATVAHALSTDYFRLYYVDLETELYVEYSPDAVSGQLTVEHHGDEFFRRSYEDIRSQVYEEDRDSFIAGFTKDNVVKSLDEHGVFNHTFRLLIGGKPVYVSMKAVRIGKTRNRMIIGVSNVDEQMRHREAVERAKEERATFERITALSDDYLCIYTVDPATGHFVEYSVMPDYEQIGFSKTGDDFFAESRLEGMRAIHPDDLDMYNDMFTMENVLHEIEENDLFVMVYRLYINNVSRYVRLKAALVEERDGAQLIIGITNIDTQVRREKEYERKLSAAQALANVDSLTGVKNKHAYDEFEARLNSQIVRGENVKFAIAVCDVNDLKGINDTYGHHVGDQCLKKGCTIVCTAFKHSPVFRIGGDEFAAIVQGHDYENIEAIVDELTENNLERMREGEVVIACGYSIRKNGEYVADVFDRADAYMYEDKKRLKDMLS